MSRPMLPHPLIDEPLGAKAIEVAALLGDSVVDVKHCIDPRSGTITRTTIAWLIGAGVTLVLAAIAFAVSVHVAAQNQQAFQVWTRVLGRPAYAFRAETLGFAYDWLVFGGFAFALAAAGIGLARLRAERRTPFYRIGSAPGVELALDDAPAPDFPLVAPSLRGDDFVMTYAPGIEGELSLDGTTTSLGELARRGRASNRVAGAVELPIPANAKIRARHGLTTFVITAVPEPRRHATPIATIERRVAAYFAGSLGVHLLILGLLAQFPEGDGSAMIELDGHEVVGIESSIVDHEPPTPVPTDEDSGDSGAGGASAALDPGQAGKPDTTTHGRLTIKDNHVDPAVARAEAIAMARTGGIAGVIHAEDFAQLVAVGEIESGFDQNTMYGAYDASMPGEASGSFGWSRSGFAHGGGGNGGVGLGTIGTGGYGTIGVGNGVGDGYGIAGGVGHGLRRHIGGVPTATIGRPEGCGDCDGRDVIRRYIKRNIEKITYCYEKQLLAHPAIGGEVVVQFFLSETGKVTGSVGSGFDSTVASCVADIVANIEFPRMPASATVRYPFTFRAPAQ
jgi:hypothetical protein